MKKLLLTTIVALAAINASAQKSIYIPNEWKNNPSTYKESDPQNTAQYSKSRSKENDNFIVYWEKGYGNKAPNELSKSDFYYVDIDDLLKQADYLYDTYVNKLKFCNEATSKVSKYKMIICLLHQEEWLATGSGYDNVIGALWVNPSTCKPVGHTIGHEIGHSFQYQSFCDHGGYAGFRTAIGNGSSFWEQTAQWQAAMTFPGPRWTESWVVYGRPFFPRTANYAMTHEWMRYQSYWWHYYLAEKYGIDFMGSLWQHDAGKGLDPNEVLMSLLKIDVNELYKMYFEYAMKMATIDLDVEGLKEEGLTWVKNYPYSFDYVSLGGSKYQVAFSSCPQSTGFNVIALNVPAAGTTISTGFTSLKQRANIADGDPLEYFNGDAMTKIATKKTYYNINTKYNNQRGFRLGYVALLKDGSRKYLYEDSLYCAEGGAGEKTVTVSAVVPENTESLYFVVSPAPKEYVQHLWNEDITDDDQWPYTVEFTNTNIGGAPLIDANLPVTDATITYDVELPRHTTEHSYVPVTLKNEALSVLGTAFQMMPSNVGSSLSAWSSAEPAEGKMKFYAVNPTTGAVVNQGSSANGYGHWFNSAGSRSDYGSGYVYSEFQPSTLTFNVGQKPATLAVDKTYTIAQALKYKKDGATAIVKFVFNVKCVSASSQANYQLKSVEQSPRINEILTGISSPAVEANAAVSSVPVAYYTLNGIRVSHPQKGVYLAKYADQKVKKVLLK
ncbi:MAG: DUF4859 domain-containing protein [Bacteroidaceae bacterium]|nr:DUF4859 domain-containing protein [Bacteroidaceae bacterium]